jgi:hypothetical protein
MDASLWKTHIILVVEIAHIGYKFKLQRQRGVPMADSDSEYRVGLGGPPLHTRFQKG